MEEKLNKSIELALTYAVNQEKYKYGEVPLKSRKSTFFIEEFTEQNSNGSYLESGLNSHYKQLLRKIEDMIFKVALDRNILDLSTQDIRRLATKLLRESFYNFINAVEYELNNK